MMQLKISDCSLDDIVMSIQLHCSVRKAQLPTLYLHSSARAHPPLFSPSFGRWRAESYPRHPSKIIWDFANRKKMIARFQSMSQSKQNGRIKCSPSPRLLSTNQRLLACHRWQSTERDKVPGRTSRRRKGVDRGYSFKKDADAQVASIEEPKKKEMSAFVIKDDSMPKYASIVEMFLPLLVAGSYFSYRYLTTASSMV
ncbi:hypothetical protein Godav_009103 [Gossypium davidsonii]|uniref:Uncharacterized protein n=2 Tax=Gossypium TaxID=3633 RepID=A0A7J8SCP6_GOSDV|nr:hypothetical protein [Gossypium davidsonii]MBA0659228.1 hypothetical protein [Gossypium klotzschianum]